MLGNGTYAYHIWLTINQEPYMNTITFRHFMINITAGVPHIRERVNFACQNM